MDNITTDWQAKKAARAAAASAMHAAFPYLVPSGVKVDSLQAAAKNIRIQLARAFPRVKFSVKSSRFSMGDSISVRWTDGPTAEQVEAITGRYSAGSFDGMTDCYNYSRDAWTDAFGDAKYIHTHRENSDRAIEAAIRTLRTRYPGNFAALAEQPTVEAYRNGLLYSVTLIGSGWSQNHSLQAHISTEAARRTWAITAKEPK